MSEYWFRRLEEEDLDFLLEIRNECSEMLHDNSKYTLEKAKEWFKNKKPEFLIINYNDNEIGYFRFSNRTENSIYIGCDLHKKWRGKKLTPKAYILVMFDLFENSHIEKIMLEVLSINSIAYNLYINLGFTVDDFQHQQIERNGQLIDSILMSINKEDFSDKLANGYYHKYMNINYE